MAAHATARCMVFLAVALPAQIPTGSFAEDHVSIELAEFGISLEEFIHMSERMDMAIRYTPEMVEGRTIAWEGVQRLRKSDFPMFFQALAHRWGLLCRMKKVDDTMVVLLSSGDPAPWTLSRTPSFRFVPPPQLHRQDLQNKRGDARKLLTWYQLAHGRPKEVARRLNSWLPGLEIGICGDGETLRPGR